MPIEKKYTDFEVGKYCDQTEAVTKKEAFNDERFLCIKKTSIISNLIKKGIVKMSFENDKQKHLKQDNKKSGLQSKIYKIQNDIDKKEEKLKILSDNEFIFDAISNVKTNINSNSGSNHGSSYIRSFETNQGNQNLWGCRNNKQEALNAINYVVNNKNPVPYNSSKMYNSKQIQAKEDVIMFKPITNENSGFTNENIDIINKISRFSTDKNQIIKKNTFDLLSRNKFLNYNLQNINDDHLDQTNHQNATINRSTNPIKTRTFENAVCLNKEPIFHKSMKNIYFLKKDVIKKIIDKKADPEKLIDHDFKRYIGRFKYKKMPQPDRLVPFNEHLKNNKSNIKDNTNRPVNTMYARLKRYKSVEKTQNINYLDINQQYHAKNNTKNEMYRDLSYHRVHFYNQNYQAGYNSSSSFDTNNINDKQFSYNDQLKRQGYSLKDDTSIHPRRRFLNSDLFTRNNFIKDESYFHPFNKIIDSHSGGKNVTRGVANNNYSVYKNNNFLSKKTVYFNSEKQNTSEYGYSRGQCYLKINERDEDMVYEAALGLLQLSRDTNKKN